MVHETAKIFGHDTHPPPTVTATCVRVPVLRAHSESINLSFTNTLSESKAREILSQAPGVRVIDERATNRFPEPLMASGEDDILVGRIRGDISQPKDRGLDIFVAGDQIRKGAALNAIQIAELLVDDARRKEYAQGGLSGSKSSTTRRSRATVVKFGGSSLANATQISRALGIVTTDPTRRFVVVSAPGKGGSQDIKVTDRLYECHKIAQEARERKTTRYEFDAHFDRTVRSRYIDIATELEMTSEQLENLENELERACAGIFDQGVSGCSADFAASRGEYLCSVTLGQLFGWDVVDAASDFIHFDTHGVLEADRTRDSVASRLVGIPQDERVVIPGFYGANAAGDVVTFPRGGSDITGSIVAGALASVLGDEKSVVYENWTDVAGVFSVDPSQVAHARPISQLHYRELHSLSEAGASVLHPAAVAPAVQYKVPIHIKNTNSPWDPGTVVNDTHRNDRLNGSAGASEREKACQDVVGIVAQYGDEKNDHSIDVLLRGGADLAVVESVCDNALTPLGPRIWRDRSHVRVVFSRNKLQISRDEFNGALSVLYDSLERKNMLLR